MKTARHGRSHLRLSKADVQAGLGAELLVLCESMTADGKLSKDEILALTRWLNTNRNAELPSIAFLVETVSRIIADRHVTREEQKELYAAIERILPNEAQHRASANRRAVNAARRAKKKAEKNAERERKRAVRERDRPVASANFMIAGVHYEGREQRIRRYACEGQRVCLVREPKNAYSHNAIQIALESGVEFGYVPEIDAEDLAPLLDAGYAQRAYITKILDGGRVPIPVVQVYIHRIDADVDGLAVVRRG
jgi:hypothetical protein